jgi:hypothetical protein
MAGKEYSINYMRVCGLDTKPSLQCLVVSFSEYPAEKPERPDRYHKGTAKEKTPRFIDSRRGESAVFFS